MAGNPNDWIPLSEAARLSGYSMGHLRHLIVAGQMEGTKLGRNYVTTRRALDAYVRTNPKPGPKRKSETESH